MDYEAFFAGHLRHLHDEGRYRVFAELERIVGAFPRARLHSRRPAAARRDGVVQQRLSRHGPASGRRRGDARARSTPRARAPAARATFPAPTRCTPSSSASWPLCTPRKPRSSSPRAMSPTRPRLQTLGAMLPGCELYSDALQPRLDDRRHPPLGRAVRKIFRHNDVGPSRELLAAADPATPKIVAFEIGLFDGRRHLADRRDLRRRASLRRADLSRRGPRASACTARAAPAWPSATARSTRSTSSQGTLAKAFGVVGGYIASTAATVDFGALLRRGLHLHHLAAAGDRRGGAGQRPPCQRPSRAARAPPGARRDAEARSSRRPACR